jgi:hypothetical protein
MNSYAYLYARSRADLAKLAHWQLEEGRAHRSIFEWEGQMNSRRLVVILTVVNLVLAVVVWANSLWAKSDSVESQQVSTVLRARAIELVNERGQVRSRLAVESSGEVVFRLLDQRGMIRVKLGAGEDGSGLVLLDEATEPGFHLIARHIGTTEKPTTTSITLKSIDGRPRVIKPLEAGDPQRGIWSTPDRLLVAWFKDPDGYTLSLTQWPM